MSEKLQKYLAAAGIGSRRQCEEYIARGKVKVNGQTATVGQRIDPEADQIYFRNKRIKPSPVHAYYAFYKPSGVISSLTSSQGKALDKFLKKIPEKVFPVGRLDKNSEGLLLLTNDGEWANCLAHPSHDHEKEYIVRTNKPVPDHVLKSFAKGMLLNGKRLRSVKYSNFLKNRKQVNLILKQGIKRQIRRMFQKHNIEVTYLKRIRIDKHELGRLKPGQIRSITP